MFVDANVFVYAFSAEPSFGAVCSDLLDRIEAADVEGAVSAVVVAELSHRLMTLEACATFGWPYAGIAQRLRQHPENLQRLHRFEKVLDAITVAGFEVIPVHGHDVLRAAQLSRKYCILTNDALLVAIMESKNLNLLASNDADFDRVPSITRFAPL